MKKAIQKSQKVFRWKQISAYAGAGAVAIAVVTPIAVSISNAQRTVKPLLDVEANYSLKDHLVMKRDNFQETKAFIQGQNGDWTKNPNWDLSFNRSTPFSFKEDDEIKKDDAENYYQGHLYTSNGIRVWTVDSFTLDEIGAHGPTSYKSDDYIFNLIKPGKTKDDYFKDLMQGLAKNSNLYAADKSLDVLLETSILSSNATYANSGTIGVGTGTNSYTKLLFVSQLLGSALARFTNQYFNPTADVSTLTNNQKIAAKLASIENGFTGNFVTNAQGIFNFINNLSALSVLSMNVDVVPGTTVAFGEYLYNVLVEDAKFAIQKALISQALTIAMPKYFSQDSNNSYKGTKIINDRLAQYFKLGNESDPTDNQGSHFSGLENRQNFAFKEKYISPIYNMLTIKGNGKTIPQDVNIIDHDALKHLPFIYEGTAMAWSGTKFVDTSGVIKPDYETAFGHKIFANEFAWRNISNKLFVRETLSNMKPSIELKQDAERVADNSFGLQTNTASYQEFKEVVNSTDLPSKGALVGGMPAQAASDPTTFKADEIQNNMTFNDGSKVIDDMKVPVPLGFYINTLYNFMTNPSLTKSANKKMLENSLWSIKNSLRFNKQNTELQTNSGVTSKSFTLFNNNNLDVILNKVYSRVLASGTAINPKYKSNSGDFNDSFLKLLADFNDTDGSDSQDGKFSKVQIESFRQLGYNQYNLSTGLKPMSTILAFHSAGLNSYTSSLSWLLGNFLTIGTYKVDAAKAPFASEFNSMISQLSAQGFNIIDSSKTKFSNEFKEGVAALLNALGKTDANVSFASVGLNATTLDVSGFNLGIISKEEIEYLMINDEKIKVHQSPTELYEADDPLSTNKLIYQKGVYQYYSEPISIGGYIYSTIKANDWLDQAIGIQAFDKLDKSVSLQTFDGRPPMNNSGESPYATAPGLLGNEDGKVVIYSFKNTKGL